MAHTVKFLFIRLGNKKPAEPIALRVFGYYSACLQTASDHTNETVWWVMTGSNRRPTPCKGAALPTELITRFAILCNLLG